MERHDFARILIATDGSKQSESAIGLAALLAHASGARVRVVHVWNLEVHHRHGVWDVETRREAQSLIEEARLRLQAAGVEAEGEILRTDSGQVAAGIAQTAREFDADLVVVGSRGLSDWQSVVKHSVSHQLLSAVDCPILIVRGRPSIAGGGAQRVLLAIAGGDDMVPGVRAAAAAAFAPGSEVLVVHVAQALFGAQGFAYIEAPEEISQTMAHATTLLQDACIKYEAMVAHSGPVAEVISGIATSWRADVIVTGSSRIGDLGSILFGSVTHELLRTIETPVLVAERAR